MRIDPIEKPQGAMMRLAFNWSKKRFGKVITPLKVINTRIPKSLRLSYELGRVAETGLTLDVELRELLLSYVAGINGCGFCVDIARARSEHLPGMLDKIAALPNYETDPQFTERERVAIRYCGEATRTKKVSDETFARMKEHFNDTEIVEITWLNALENYYNLLNGPLQIESDGLCAIPQRPREAATA